MGSRDKFDRSYRRIVRGLVEHRTKAGITQQRVAESMGVDQSRVSKFERGERRLDIIDFVRYCDAVGLEPGAALTSFVGQDDPGPDPD